MYGWEMKLDDFTIQLGVHMDPETQPEHTLTALQCDAGEERRHRRCEEVCGRHQRLTLSVRFIRFTYICRNCVSIYNNSVQVPQVFVL